MLQLLFTMIFSEMALIMVLSFKTPLRKLVITSLDRVKHGRGPVVVKTVAGTLSFFQISSVYSMLKIQKRQIDGGVISPTDQVLMSKHILEATLMDRLHYIRELRIGRKSIEAVKKQNRGFENRKAGNSEETKALGKK